MNRELVMSRYLPVVFITQIISIVCWNPKACTIALTLLLTASKWPVKL